MADRPPITGSIDTAPSPDGAAAFVLKLVQPDTTDPAELSTRTRSECAV